MFIIYKDFILGKSFPLPTMFYTVFSSCYFNPQIRGYKKSHNSVTCNYGNTIILG